MREQLVTVVMTLISFVYSGMCATARVESIYEADMPPLSLFESMYAPCAAPASAHRGLTVARPHRGLARRPCHGGPGTS